MVLIKVLVNQGKRLVLTLLKQGQNLSLYYNVDNSFLVEKKSLTLKLMIKMLNFLTQTFFESIFGANESREVSFNKNFYRFSVGYSANDKSDRVNI